MDYLLGIDAGTTAFKAVLFDIYGEEIAVATYEYNLEYPFHEGVELDPEKYWEAFKSVIRIIFSKYKGNTKEIKALAIASQAETLISVDPRGKPLRKAIVWLDNRAGSEAEQIKSAFGRDIVFKISGQPDIVPTWPAAKILWMRKNEPELFNKVSRFLLLEDYLVFRLTNKYVSEGSLLSSTLMFDINTGQWWQDMLKFIGISAGQLPEITKSGQIISEITDKAANETGLCKTTIVVSGAFDHAASAIGSGNTGFKFMTESTGSTLAICANVPEPVYDPMRIIPCHYHAIPDAYFLLPWCQTAGMVYKWFRDEFYNEIKSGVKSNPEALYKLMDDSAAAISPGSDGLLLLPHLAGAFTPESNPNARGVFFGISLQTGKAHFTRAILEAIAFMLRRNISLLEGMGHEVNEIRSNGGGSKSDLWNQIKADVCQKPVVTVKVTETASLGAAMLAGYALNFFSNLDEASEKMIRLNKRYIPEKLNDAVYSKAYDRYINLYNLLEPMF